MASRDLTGEPEDPRIRFLFEQASPFALPDEEDEEDEEDETENNQEGED
jgi:hypothetical protein